MRVRHTAVAVAGTGLSVAAYAALVERNAYVLRRFTVPCLPEGERPLRLLHLSDLHLVARQRRRAAWVRGLTALEPDVVLATGDFVGGADGIPAVLAALEDLLHLPGAFVLGSNDYYAPRFKNPLRYLWEPSSGGGDAVPLPTAQLVEGLARHGWVDLTNRRATLTADGRELDLVGVDDPHLDLDVMPNAAPTRGMLRVGVSHAPYRRVLDDFVADGASLLIAGHTHGGQVCVPGYGALVSNCDLPTRQAKGLSRWGSAWLHVSAGLGTSVYAPFRLACRPEASLLTLVAPGHPDPEA